MAYNLAMSSSIPLVDLKAQYAAIRPAVDQAIQHVLDSTNFIMGPEVKAFEAAFAAYCGATFCIGVASGTAALELVLRALGVGPGDEVITVAHTFIATAEAISAVGARPVFVDIDPITYNMAPSALAAALTAATRAIIPVHIYGQPADMDAIRAIAAVRQLPVIEDAAQAHGATWRGKRAGALGDAACFSFYPGKNLGAYGDAGAVTTDDAALAEQVRLLRNHGRRAKYEHEVKGYGERLDTLQAAILAAKLPYLDDWTAARQRLAARYGELLADCEVTIPALAPQATSAWHLYVIRTPRRDELLGYLNQHGVGRRRALPAAAPSAARLRGPGLSPWRVAGDRGSRGNLSQPAALSGVDRSAAGAGGGIDPRVLGHMSTAITLSVVVPARNEEATIGQVVERSFAAFAQLGCAGEVLVVNDGSTDRTGPLLAELQSRFVELHVFTHRRGQGMTAGLQKMFNAARGEIVILIPADMESDPLVDVPALVNCLEANDLDVAAGWRQERNDGKVLASRVYNLVMRRVGGVDVHDGNWIKAMRREVIESFPPLRSDWHRFLLDDRRPQRLSDRRDAHLLPAQTGRASKFGWERIPKSFLDVLVLRFLLTFSEAPMRFFGGLGLLGLAASVLIFVYLLALYVFAQTQQRPIFIGAGVLAIISVLLFLVGFLAELIVTQGERITALERRNRRDSEPSSTGESDILLPQDPHPPTFHLLALLLPIPITQPNEDRVFPWRRDRVQVDIDLVAHKLARRPGRVGQRRRASLSR